VRAERSCASAEPSHIAAQCRKSNVSFRRSLQAAPRLTNLLQDFRGLKSQVCSLASGSRVTQTQKQLRFKTRHSDFFGCPYMKPRMQLPARVFGHEDVHLTFRKRLHVDVLHAVFLLFPLGGCPSLLVPLMNENALLRQTVAATRNGFLCGCPNEIARCLFV